MSEGYSSGVLERGSGATSTVDSFWQKVHKYAGCLTNSENYQEKIDLAMEVTKQGFELVDKKVGNQEEIIDKLLAVFYETFPVDRSKTMAEIKEGEWIRAGRLTEGRRYTEKFLALANTLNESQQKIWEKQTKYIAV